MERHQILAAQLVAIANELGWNVHTVECDGVYEAFILAPTEVVQMLIPDLPIAERRPALRLVTDD